MSFESSMEPYAQLVRSLLPRAAALCLFDHTGKLLWSSVANTNAELFALVLQAIAQADAAGNTHAEAAGLHAALPDEAPAYLFWLRDERGALAAVAAVVCNRLTTDANVLPLSYVQEHLRPALVLLRRDLLARADIEKINERSEEHTSELQY